MKTGIFGALFTLTTKFEYTQIKCIEAAKYVTVHSRAPIICESDSNSDSNSASLVKIRKSEIKLLNQLHRNWWNKRVSTKQNSEYDVIVLEKLELERF